MPNGFLPTGHLWPNVSSSKMSLQSARCTLVQNSLMIGHHQISHFPICAGVSERVVWTKQMSERCEWTTKRTSEWPTTNVPITDSSTSPCYHLFISLKIAISLIRFTSPKLEITWRWNATRSETRSRKFAGWEATSNPCQTDKSSTRVRGSKMTKSLEYIDNF